MSWRDSLQLASFRGVTFFVEGSSIAGGRHTVTHEFPGRDNSYTEDINLKPKNITVDAFLLGDKHVAEALELLVECDKKGPGELVHPWLGKMVLTCSDYTLTFSHRDGRIAIVSMQFVKPTTGLPPTTSVSTYHKSLSASATTLTAAKESFASVFSVVGKASHIVTDANNRVVNALDVVENAKLQARKSMEFLHVINNLKRNMNQLLSDPFALATSLASVISFGFGGIDGDSPTSTATINDLSDIYLMFGFGDSDAVPQGSVASVVTARNNQVGLALYTQTAATIAAVRIAADLTFTSTNDAIKVRDAIVNQIEIIMNTCTDQVFTALQDLRAAIVSDINSRSINLPNINSFVSPVTVPSIILAHRINGTLDNEFDLIDRNKIRNPFAIPGGISLEVLTNE